MKLNVAQVTQYGRIDLPPRVSYAAFTAEETLEALGRLKDGSFTLTCSFDPPHPPMIVQEPYHGMYPPETIPVPESLNDPMEDSPYRERSKEKDQVRYRDAKQIRHMRSIYYGMVKEVDDWIGEILEKLDELGLADNTLVIFTSDHGEMRNLILSPILPEKNLEQAKMMKARLVQWMKEHEPHKVNDLEQRKLF